MVTNYGAQARACTWGWMILDFPTVTFTFVCSHCFETYYEYAWLVGKTPLMQPYNLGPGPQMLNRRLGIKACSPSGKLFCFLRSGQAV